MIRTKGEVCETWGQIINRKIETSAEHKVSERRGEVIDWINIESQINTIFSGRKGRKRKEKEGKDRTRKEKKGRKRKEEEGRGRKRKKKKGNERKTKKEKKERRSEGRKREQRRRNNKEQ